MGRHHCLRWAFPAFALLGLAAAVLASTLVPASAASTRSEWVRIQSAPRIPRGTRKVGALSASTSVSGTVVLKPRNSAALTRFIAAVTNRNSPMFHHYLPAGAFAKRFGPSAATLEGVRSQLLADGLRVSTVSSDRMFVSFKGSAARIEDAFHTSLARYRLADGASAHAASAVTLPPTIARSIAAVLGLNDLVRERPANILRVPESDAGRIPASITGPFRHPSGSPTPCVDATSAAQSLGGLTDDQIANAYGAFGQYAAGDLGAGQHIALYELEPFAFSDVQTFDSCFFGASAASSMLGRLKVIPVDGGQPTGPGSGEANLDVEDIAAMAPGATIDVYEGPSPGPDGVDYDPVDPYVAMIDTDRDQIISTSWGLCEQAIQAGQPGLQQAENLLFEQAAAQGQSVFAAAGDNGSDDCNTFETDRPAAGQNPVSVDDPGSQPYVISVGGTTITNASTQPPAEHIWNDGAHGGGGGGGISESWTMPAWQRSATVPGIAVPGSAAYTDANSVEEAFGYAPNFCQANVPDSTSSTPCRVVPDVSSQGDYMTGAVTVYDKSEGGWTTVGGTSSSTPIWASMLAVINASSTCSSQPATRNGVGFANALLYGVASNPSGYAASFNDVTDGNNDVYGLDNNLVFPATPGYDLASGLGSPRLTGPDGTAGLAYYLCSFAADANRPVVSGLSPSSGSIAGGQTVKIIGKGFEVGGVSDVAQIQVGNSQLRPGRFTVNSATSITAIMPPARDTLAPDAPAPQDGAGPADVIVVLQGDRSSMPSPSSTYEYVDTSSSGAVPSITGVVPVGGPETSPGAVVILGSGFTGATNVTFGDVPATSFTVNSPYRITASPAPYGPHTVCSPLPNSGVYTGKNPANDVCQVQVRVANAHGINATGHILPPFEGPVVLDAIGVLEAPPGCGCETAQAPSEFDYLPPPHVTSVSTSAGPSSYANENGATVITIHGTGFDPMNILWVDIGSPGDGASMDVNYVQLTATEIQIVALPEPATTGPTTFPLSVKTLAGQSNEVPVTYAGS